MTTSSSKSDTTSPVYNTKQPSFLSRTLSSKRDRSNSVGRNRPSPPLPSTNKESDHNSDDSTHSTPQLSPSKDLPPSSAFGKARDRSTFKGVIDKFVGSFNGIHTYTHRNLHNSY